MQLHEVLDNVGSSRLLVIGDVILDRYTWGEAERVSPEAPVLVLNADDEEVRPGGAASVAALLRGLDARASIIGVVGDDADGRVVNRILEESGVEIRLLAVDPSRPTTSKERFLGRTGRRQPHQMLRVDREVRRPIDANIEAQLIERTVAAIDEFDAILISDYAKGACTPRLLAETFAAARRRGVPVLVDPARIADYSRYRGATILKPNRIEMEAATGSRIQSSEDAVVLGRRLRHALELEAIVVTLDRDGMVLVAESDVAECVPTTPREVCDVTGAGDMSLAMLGLCAAAKVPLSSAVRLANAASGLEIQRQGIATVSREEVADALQPAGCVRHSKHVAPDVAFVLADKYRRQGKRIVFTNGCFDLLHVGHVACLEEAATLGDVLFVAVNSDASVKRIKGATRPVIGQEARAATIASMACVTCVFVHDDDTPHALLRTIQPDVLVKGGTTPCIVGDEIVLGRGGVVHRTALVPGASTSGIVQGILTAR